MSICADPNPGSPTRGMSTIIARDPLGKKSTRVSQSSAGYRMLWLAMAAMVRAQASTSKMCETARWRVPLSPGSATETLLAIAGGRTSRARSWRNVSRPMVPARSSHTHRIISVCTRQLGHKYRKANMPYEIYKFVVVVNLPRKFMILFSFSKSPKIVKMLNF